MNNVLAFPSTDSQIERIAKLRAQQVRFSDEMALEGHIENTDVYLCNSNSSFLLTSIHSLEINNDRVELYSKPYEKKHGVVADNPQDFQVKIYCSSGVPETKYRTTGPLKNWSNAFQELMHQLYSTSNFAYSTIHLPFDRLTVLDGSSIVTSFQFTGLMNVGKFVDRAESFFNDVSSLR